MMRHSLRRTLNPLHLNYLKLMVTVINMVRNMVTHIYFFIDSVRECSRKYIKKTIFLMSILKFIWFSRNISIIRQNLFIHNVYAIFSAEITYD